MNWKKCNTCRINKPLAEFSWRNKKEGKKLESCKKCYQKRRKEYYKKNHEKEIARMYKTRDNNIKKVLLYLLGHPCVDCEENDYLVLQFDHVRGKKKASISQLVRSSPSWEKIADEIKKCEVRCANCHTRRTAKQKGWHRIKIAKGLSL